MLLRTGVHPCVWWVAGWLPGCLAGGWVGGWVGFNVADPFVSM